MRGENETESLVVFFSVLLIRIGKQNVKIIEKQVEIEKCKNELFKISCILMCLSTF